MKFKPSPAKWLGPYGESGNGKGNVDDEMGSGNCKGKFLSSLVPQVLRPFDPLSLSRIVRSNCGSILSERLTWVWLVLGVWLRPPQIILNNEGDVKWYAQV
ncbi:hypothetical protein N9L68_07135 [bacterium]|nr:hypothetical protein [bacterium]